MGALSLAAVFDRLAAVDYASERSCGTGKRMVPSVRKPNAMYHRVKQGEHLSRLAQQYGFSDYCTIWNHPQNAELKRKRNNPNVLYPGDILFIPDRELCEEVRPTDQCHAFVLRRPNLKLRLVLEDQYEKPVANA